MRFLKQRILNLVERQSSLTDTRFQKFIRRNFDASTLPVNPIFEPAWLELSAKIPPHLPPAVAFSRRNALQRACTHPLFDPGWYAATYPETKNHPLGALGDYLSSGEIEGRAPSKWWTGSKPPLTKALYRAHEFLLGAADVNELIPDGEQSNKDLNLKTILIFQDASEALAQAQALAEANWPYATTVFVGGRFKRVSDSLERTRITSAIALARNFGADVFFITGLNDALAKLRPSEPICLLQGRPTARLLRSISSNGVVASLQGAGLEQGRLIFDLVDPRTSNRDSPEWGEVLIAQANLLEALKSFSHSSLTSDEAISQIVTTAARAELVAFVAGMEQGDEFALPPEPNALRVRPRAESLRWQLITPVTSSNVKGNWGDTWFAQDLAQALRSLGQVVTIDSQSSSERATSPLTDVVLTLRGVTPVAHTAKNSSSIAMAWLISNPESLQPGEFDHLDAVFVASNTFLRNLDDIGVRAIPLLQATNPRKFKPLSQGEISARVGEYLRKRLQGSLLFVGGARAGGRPIVTDAQRSGAKLSVFGHGWHGLVTEDELLGENVPNEDLTAFYQASGVVLADHEESMRRHGFVSNRIFDAAASGARVLADRPSGEKYLIEDLFGASVRTYQDIATFRGLVTDPKTAWPNDELRRENALRVGRENSFESRAQVLLETAQRLTSQAREPALL